MKIESVRIENFRAFKDVVVNFDDYTCFIGANGAGKSTVLNALNVFFRQFKDTKTDLIRLSVDDFHHKDTSNPIKITVTFNSLSKEAESDFSDYVRLGKLIISAVAEYDPITGRAEVKQKGSRLGFEDFKTYFIEDKNGAKVSELKEIYSTFQIKYPKLPKATTKADMTASLRQHEADNPTSCILIESADEFYGISKGANKLNQFIQWVYVPAVKDATEECHESKNSALGELLARTVRSKINFSDKIQDIKNKAQKEYQTILDGEQAALDEISSSLQNKLKAWAHPEASAQVLWKQDSDKSVKLEDPWAYIEIGERGFEGDLSRFGHGLQRSYMLALLHELTEIDDSTAPTLIMGIEEPELYQHPPQTRYLAETLYDLSEKTSQIILCSHSPLFIPGDNFDKIRVVRENGNPSISCISQLHYDQLAAELTKAGDKLLKEKGILAKLYPSLNPVVNEMFFCNKLILVEGIEDVAYITTYLHLTDNITEFRRLGCHIVPVGGKSEMTKPLAMANLLNIPTYIVCDADTNKDQIEDENRRKSEVEKHKKDNRSLLVLTGHDKESEWPSNDFTNNNITMWKTNLTEVVKEDMGVKWAAHESKAAAHYGNAANLKKNPLTIAHALELAWNDDVKSTSLIQLIDSIIAFSQTN